MAQPHVKKSFGKIIFLNQLRGLAALFVVCAHYLNNFWFHHSGIAGYIHAPALENIDPPFLATLFHQIPLIKFGEFGVALFFLISGFVIPLSLERHGTLSFLIGRFFRIWPLYLAGLSVTLLVFYAMTTYLGKPFPFTIGQMLVQSVIFLRDWLHFPNIDGIVWTLEIEIKFYVFMAVWFYLFQNINHKNIARFMVMFCLTLIVLKLGKSYIFYNAKPLYHALSVLSFAATMISYMVCGTLFYLIFVRRLAIGESIPYFLVFIVCFIATWSLGFYGAGRYAIPQYILALVVFAGCFVLKDYFRPNKLLDWLASISYPLYVVHAALGYSIMYLFISWRWPEALALVFAIVSSFTVATALHYLVERPSNFAGKSLARSFGSGHKASLKDRTL